MANLSKEPITTLSAVLFLRQAVEINAEIERTGENRSAIIRRLIDRGMEAERKDGAATEKEAAA